MARVAGVEHPRKRVDDRRACEISKRRFSRTCNAAMAVDSRADITLGSQAVEVEIISPVTPEIARTVDCEWRPLLEAARTEDREWPAWEKIIADHSGTRFASFAMVSPSSRVEGIVVLESGRAMQATPFAEGATMHFLATAPWNRLNSDRTPLFPAYERAKPVGSILLTRAFLYSREMGYEGRLNWESLEGSEDWYRKQFLDLPGSITELPRSLSSDNYLTFETDSKRGLAYLSRNETRLKR